MIKQSEICVLYSQKLEIKIITKKGSGNGKQKVLQRCQTLRLHPAPQSLSPFLWVHHRFVTFLSVLRAGGDGGEQLLHSSVARDDS